jgi:hypothetical protein
VRLPDALQYLAVVRDAYSRRVVGWESGGDLGTELALAALNQVPLPLRPETAFF